MSTTCEKFTSDYDDAIKEILMKYTKTDKYPDTKPGHRLCIMIAGEDVEVIFHAVKKEIRKILKDIDLLKTQEGLEKLRKRYIKETKGQVNMEEMDDKDVKEITNDTLRHKLIPAIKADQLAILRCKEYPDGYLIDFDV